MSSWNMPKSIVWKPAGAQSAPLDIYAVRAWYIIDGAIRYTLYIYDTDCIRLKQDAH